ncbi:MAG TPA: DUF423 domain-containing protein [Cycloclasticus sp.]|jgi:uncharacterized membrane protein YgdD (TMEM256/DUF423 family)|nr:DUF423 domain-containing protein [Cycloclasticus sp.]HIL92404.1 DUF423 domain-containing protein [Cycloclasticus sp.]
MKTAPFIALGALFAFLAVMFGAFGAHALKGQLSEYSIAVYQTATDYQMWHAIGLIVIGLLNLQQPSKHLHRAGWLMLAGILIFSGSLYALSLSGIKILGAITPVGGVCFLIAWLLVAYSTIKSK